MAISADEHPGKSQSARRFAELHALTNYSFLRGASHPEELVEQAARLGYRAIAITDECSFAGLVKAHLAAKAHDMHLIVGAEFHLEDDLHLVLLGAAFAIAASKQDGTGPSREAAVRFAMSELTLCGTL